MTPLQVLKKYQGNRSLRAYAIVLDISPTLLSQVYRGTRNVEGGQVITGFLRAFPDAADEMTAALSSAPSVIVVEPVAVA